eukprot:8191026-Pyramimonas_sp.AAC.1
MHTTPHHTELHRSPVEGVAPENRTPSLFPLHPLYTPSIPPLHLLYTSSIPPLHLLLLGILDVHNVGN